MLKIAVFVSGRGSNLKSILDSIPGYLDKVEVKFVISDKSDCGAFDIADQFNIPKMSVSNLEKPEFINYNELIKKFRDESINLIVLAGFLKKIPDTFIEEFTDKIINIHPALLPAFGGKGMYGSNVHKAVFEKSVMVSGPTVHFVDKIYDNGKIIAQESVNISDVNSPEEIAERVLKVEHKILPMVIKKISENKLEIKNNRVYLKN